MNFIIKTMSGSEIKITREEYEKIRTLQKGFIHLNSGKSINLSSVDSIIPESDHREEKSESNLGVLHDGQDVIKHFGRWYLNNGEIDEKGKPTVVVDPSYYPEVSKDRVPSPQEFENKYLKLQPKERLALMVGEQREGGLQKININKYEQNLLKR